MQLLLLSSAQPPGCEFLEHALPAVADLMDGRERMLFVPYGRRDFDTCARAVHSVLSSVGIKLDGLHRATDPVAAIRSAEVVFLGGGAGLMKRYLPQGSVPRPIILDDDKLNAQAYERLASQVAGHAG